MPIFEYRALDSSGKSSKGSLDAENLRAARQKLRSRGVFPTDIREGANVTNEPRFKDIQRYFESNRVSGRELAVATRQLATLVGAGLPLVNALSALADQVESKIFKSIVIKVREQVEEGSSLAKALGNFPRAFPRLYVNLVASGEASGTLDAVLLNLAEHLESQLEMKRKVSSALAYPILMLFVCSAVVIALLTFVVPRIVEIFKRQNLPLPLPTRIVLGASNALTDYWPILILLVFFLIYAYRWYYKRPDGRAAIDALVLRAPVIGRLYIKTSTARIARTLSTLLASGVDLLTALDIARNIAGNVHLVSAIEKAREGVREGRSLAGEFSRSAILPPMLCHMIAVGEKSGELENMLTHASKAYENEVNATLSGLTSLLEPVMMIIVAAIVLFIMISVLLPMADMIGKIQ